MRAWVVRAGKDGENEDFALEKDVVVIGWDDLGDLSNIKGRDEVREMLRAAGSYDDNRLANYTGQIFRFARKIAVGDLVVLPCKTTGTLAVGRCSGGYGYQPNNPPGARHVRPVNWLRTEQPRHSLAKDLLHTIGSLLTVFELKRNSAVDRLNEFVRTGQDPELAASSDGESPDLDLDSIDAEGAVDVEQLAADRIEAHVAEKFKGHKLARLVEAVLEAEGYVTRLSPPGPDGGVDVLVGSGPLGLQEPKIVVQVKSGKALVDAPTMRNLQGAARNFGADTALYVAWSGFTRGARQEATNQWFQLRIWDSGALIDKITENYDRLPKEIQADLPLKQIWVLAHDET